jgi:predicted negative regulator of RcsB-dependent stress response
MNLSHLIRLVSAVGLGFLILLAAGCQEDQYGGDPNESVPAMVAMAQSYHEQADIAVQNDDLAAAETAMVDLVSALDNLTLEHRERLELGMDAYARLARIRMDQEDLEGAYDATNQGLLFGEEAAQDSLFAGYLHQIRGDILRARGDDRGAVDAHKDAIAVFKLILDSQAAP